MDNPEYESILTLLREIHKNPNPSTSRPQSDEEMSNDGRDRNQSLSIVDIENPQSRRKRSIFESKLKIPILTITGSHVAGLGNRISSPETSENGEHRKFSFGNFRRHSHVFKNSFFTSKN